MAFSGFELSFDGLDPFLEMKTVISTFLPTVLILYKGYLSKIRIWWSSIEFGGRIYYTCCPTVWLSLRYLLYWQVNKERDVWFVFLSIYNIEIQNWRCSIRKESPWNAPWRRLGWCRLKNCQQRCWCYIRGWGQLFSIWRHQNRFSNSMLHFHFFPN